MRVSHRSMADVKYVEAPVYTGAQLSEFERTARDAVCRAGGQPRGFPAVAPGHRRRHTSYRAHSARWFFDWVWAGVLSLVFLASVRRGLVVGSATSFDGWRAFRFFEIFEVFSWAWTTTQEAGAMVEEDQDRAIEFQEKYNNGDLVLLLFAAGLSGSVFYSARGEYAGDFKPGPSSILSSDSSPAGSPPKIMLLEPNENVARVVTSVQNTAEGPRSGMLEHLKKFNDILDWVLDSKERKNNY